MILACSSARVLSIGDYSGGQYDLRHRFLAPVFLPDLWDKADNPLFGEHVRRLADITLAVERGEQHPRARSRRLDGVPLWGAKACRELN
jgi:hypothetical protein